MKSYCVSPLPLALFIVLLLAPVVSFGQVSSANAAPRGLNVRKELPASRKRYALVIGVDTYDDPQINRLAGAANDAQAIAGALTQYAGFPADQVILLASDQPRERQPTRGNILKRLANLRGAVPEDGLLLVSFAGHGLQHEGKAFLLPSDAQTGDLTLLEDTTINVEIVRERVQQTGVKQVIMVLDACRNNPSGRGDAGNLLTDAYTKAFDFYQRNREVEAFATLYATEIGYRAYEYTERKHGYFTWALVEGLKGGAANERNEVTLAGLVKYLQEQVPKRIQLDLGQEKKQRPWADIQGYKADDLVLAVVARPPVNPPVAAPAPETAVTTETDPAAIEAAVWDGIKNSKDPVVFRDYLKKYPKGKYAEIARKRIKQLENAARIQERQQPVFPSPDGPPGRRPGRRPGI